MKKESKAKTKRVTNKKKYLVLIISFLIMLWFWYLLAFAKLYCACAWNDYGFIISTFVALLAFSLHTLNIRFMIKNNSRGFIVKYLLSLVVVVFLYMLIMITLLNLLS